MDLEFEGELFKWVGPAPWYFVRVPTEQCELLQAASKFLTYGWGMIPIGARVGQTEWKTSLFPKDGVYLVPIKASVRKAERLELGEVVSLQLHVGS